MDLYSGKPTSSRIAARGARGTIEIPAASEQPGWETAAPLPSEAWKEASRKIEKKLRHDFPTLLNKYAVWFAPMPVAGVHTQGNEVRIQYECSNPHRRQEVEKLRPILEPLLADELFPGASVIIELSGSYPASASSEEDKPKDLFPEESRQLPETQTAISQPFGPPDQNDGDTLDYYRQRVKGDIRDEDLQAVLQTLSRECPREMQAHENERLRLEKPSASTHSSPPSCPMTRLEDILVEPSYATLYDEIVRSHSAVYLPAYFVRHLRHMGASNGLRYMALCQMAYLQGYKGRNGSQSILATTQDLCRWSTLQPRRILGDLEDPSAYLYLLASRMAYHEYYSSRPDSARWEDASGFHWKASGREYCVWKKDGRPTEDCSQLIYDRSTGKPQWRQAPAVYRVQLSMPLCPEDEARLRSRLRALNVRADPLEAIRQCLLLPRDELLPDRPEKLLNRPRKLYTVQELVMEEWGASGDRGLSAQVAAQSRLLEAHLVRAERDLLKIPFYLLEKWGKRLSPAQLWTAIILIDRVYASAKDDEYRDTTTIRNGIKEMMLWTEDEYSKGAARKIMKWLYPFDSNDSSDLSEPGSCYNPWFSIFATEILAPGGARVRNSDNTVQMKLRVLPMVPLAPEDTLLFARKMGLERLLAQDASGAKIALEITQEELVAFFPGGRTLRYTYTGELRYGEKDPVSLSVLGKNLEGIELFSSEHFYQVQNWPGALFGGLENEAGALSGMLENQPGALFDNLGATAGALSGSLVLDPGALFGVLLKLLIFNLYGIQNNSNSEKAPSTRNLEENVDALEQFGARQGQYIRWMGDLTDKNWDFYQVARSLGISDIQGLRRAEVTAEALVATALSLFATPAGKFENGRVSVLVSRLRSNPTPQPGSYLRLAGIGPQNLQVFFRRSILNLSTSVGDPDWDQGMAQVKRDDLIELAEKLGLARVFRLAEHEQ